LWSVGRVCRPSCRGRASHAAWPDHVCLKHIDDPVRAHAAKRLPMGGRVAAGESLRVGYLVGGLGVADRRRHRQYCGRQRNSAAQRAASMSVRRSRPGS
jgi:hypothetical protein